MSDISKLTLRIQTTITWPARFMLWVLEHLDARDWHIYGGLLISAIGGLLISARWTLVIIGAVLTTLGLFGPLLRRKGA